MSGRAGGRRGAKDQPAPVTRVGCLSDIEREWQQPGRAGAVRAAGVNRAGTGARAVRDIQHVAPVGRPGGTAADVSEKVIRENGPEGSCLTQMSRRPSRVSVTASAFPLGDRLCVTR